MSKYNKNKHHYKKLFYENEYYEDTDESYKILLLSRYNDKLPYIKQLVSLFLKCFPLIRSYKNCNIFYNPKKDIESTFLSSENKLYLLIEENSNKIISFFMISYLEYDKVIISNACTDPNYTRKGFMRQLLNTYLNKINKKVEIEVYEDNPARNLYESIGFKFVKYIDSEGPNDFWEDGMYSKKCLYNYKQKTI